jgi:hypothetical protein
MKLGDTCYFWQLKIGDKFTSQGDQEKAYIKLGENLYGPANNYKRVRWEMSRVGVYKTEFRYVGVDFLLIIKERVKA